jgi:hypothetical protein
MNPDTDLADCAMPQEQPVHASARGAAAGWPRVTMELCGPFPADIRPLARLYHAHVIAAHQDPYCPVPRESLSQLLALANGA